MRAPPASGAIAGSRAAVRIETSVRASLRGSASPTMSITVRTDGSGSDGSTSTWRFDDRRGRRRGTRCRRAVDLRDERATTLGRHATIACHVQGHRLDDVTLGARRSARTSATTSERAASIAARIRGTYSSGSPQPQPPCRRTRTEQRRTRTCVAAVGELTDLASHRRRGAAWPGHANNRWVAPGAGRRSAVRRVRARPPPVRARRPPATDDRHFVPCRSQASWRPARPSRPANETGGTPSTTR